MPREGESDCVPPAERIAVFGNDGTLWVEQPMYIQLAFGRWKIVGGSLSLLSGDAVLACLEKVQGP